MDLITTTVEEHRAIGTGSPAEVRPLSTRRFQKLRAYFDKPWARCLLLAAIGFAVRLPALQGEPIWDDSFLAQDNPLIKSPILFFETFRHHLLIGSFSAHYRPVQNISYMLDYAVWHTNWYGFHLSNVLWHVGSGVFLYFLLQELIGALSTHRSSAETAPANPGTTLQSGTGGAVVSFFLALLWMVHPVHSAAVDYIAGRADSLAFFFAAGAWLLYLRGAGAKVPWTRYLCFAIAPVSLLAALCSRESACMWVLVFLIHLLTLEKRVSRGTKVATVAVCLAVVGIYGGLRQLPGRASAQDPSSEWTPVVRSTLMLRALGDYGRLMLLPANLHMERSVIDPRQTHGVTGWREGINADYLSVLGLLVAGGLLYGSLRKGSARPVRAFGAAWFILSYLPISNMIELNATVAEHWLYLPSVGFLIFLGGCCMELPRRFHGIATAAACCFVVALGVRSYVRSSDWVCAETFYQRTLAAGGTSVRVALNLGYIYSTRGELERAEGIFRNVLKTTPDFLIAQNNLGDALQKQGKTAEADAVFAAASDAAATQRKTYPRTWMAALNVAHNDIAKGDEAAAMTILQKANADYPATWNLISLQAELLRKNEGAAAAIPMVQEFAQERWWHAMAWHALGRLLFENGDTGAAEDALRHASRLDIHDAESLNTIALLQIRQNRLGDAYKSQRLAVSREPDEPRQYLMLSDILTKMGRTTEAASAVAQMERLQAVARGQSVIN